MYCPPYIFIFNTKNSISNRIRDEVIRGTTLFSINAHFTITVAAVYTYFFSIKTPGRVHESFAMIFTSHHLSVSNYYPLPFPMLIIRAYHKSIFNARQGHCNT